ncbi:hypothetical protein NDU88_009339 [Pleurodeles waltl]|uniref:Uncharacterized protein n=1 Tax=Pleurodeles waltl TaxID=8319 RepID=A0AAV7RUY4_PLEWA|nr:hypothetical protein NDU88_009339 [Pleurodeles waltl]
MMSPQRPAVPMASPFRPAVPMSSPFQLTPMMEPQVTTAPMGSTPAPDGSGLDRSQPSSPGPHLSVLKPVSLTSANSVSTPRLEARLRLHRKTLRL